MEATWLTFGLLGHRTGWSPCAHSVGNLFFSGDIVDSLPSGTSAPGGLEIGNYRERFQKKNSTNLGSKLEFAKFASSYLIHRSPETVFFLKGRDLRHLHLCTYHFCARFGRQIREPLKTHLIVETWVQSLKIAIHIIHEILTPQTGFDRMNRRRALQGWPKHQNVQFEINDSFLSACTKSDNVHFCMSLPEVQRRRKRPLGEDPCSWLPTWPFSWSFFIIPRFIRKNPYILTGVVRPFAAFIQSWLAISVKMNMFSFLGYICWCSICHLNDFPSSKETNCCAKGNASKKETGCRQKETCKVHFLRIVPARQKGWKGHMAPPWHCTSVPKKMPLVLS